MTGPAVLDQLAAAIGRHSILATAVARRDGGRRPDCAVPRLRLVVLDEPIDPVDLLYEPMICFVAEGAKRAVAGDRDWVTGRGEMFLSSLVLPVTASFERVPYRSAVLSLNGRVLSDLLLELEGTSPRTSPDPGGQITATMTPELVDAVTRWVRLLDTPEDIGPLAGRIESEIVYRLLGSPLGATLRQLTLADSGAARIREVAGWISAHYAEPLSIDAIAGMAHMSTATLHRRFKSATGMSPLRFQKQLRLQEARQQLLAGNATAARIAEAVGYASATQFNREYRRVYGLPPAQDAARLRHRLTSPPLTGVPG